MRLDVKHIAAPLPLAPRRTLANRYHFEQLNNQRFITRFCRDCRSFTYPPLPWCPRCNSRAMDWRAPAITGSLYAKTRMHAVATAFREHAPITVGVIDLEDDIRLLAWLLDPHLQLDSPVELICIQFEDGTLLGARAGPNHTATPARRNTK